MPLGRHIYAKAHDTEKEYICAYSQSDNGLPQWKLILRCCAKCPGINLCNWEKDDQYPDNSPSIRFHIYHMIAHCTKHIRLPVTDFFLRRFHQDSTSGQSTKIYTRKEQVMMTKKYYYFHTSFIFNQFKRQCFALRT